MIFKYKKNKRNYSHMNHVVKRKKNTKYIPYVNIPDQFWFLLFHILNTLLQLGSLT